MPKPEGKFREKRHPHCPECRYNLIATVESGRRICPECGYEFEMYELRGEKRSGDWTFQIGLRNAVISLILRSLVILPMWVVIIWVIITFKSKVSSAVLTILPLLGIAMGYGFSRNLSDRAGFSGSVLLFISWFFTICVIICGIAIVQQIQPLTSYQKIFFSSLGGLPALLWILKVMVLDD